TVSAAIEAHQCRSRPVAAVVEHRSLFIYKPDPRAPFTRAPLRACDVYLGKFNSPGWQDDQTLTVLARAFRTTSSDPLAPQAHKDKKRCSDDRRRTRTAQLRDVVERSLKQ